MKAAYNLQKPTSLVFDYLTDMQKFVSVHPVIYKIEKIWDGEYLVFETLRLGLFPYSFTYKVRIESDAAAGKISMFATVMKLTKIEMYFQIEQTGSQACLVREEISFRSPLPVKFMMSRIFKKQHSTIFANIENLA